MYVPASQGQALAFAAKVAEALIVPQLAAYISLHSPRKAIQVSFFTSFSNVFSLLFDPRSWKHVRNMPYFPTRISLASWLVIGLSLALWLAIQLSDLLVFQLSPTVPGFKFVASAGGLGATTRFSDTNATFYNRTIRAPSALLNDTELESVFQNKTYILGSSFQYLSHAPQRMTSSDGTFDFISMLNVSSPEFDCHSVVYMDSYNALFGINECLAYCTVNGTAATEIPTMGFNKGTVVQALQATDGAVFTFTSTHQRVSSVISEPDSSTPAISIETLNKMTQNYTLLSQFQGEKSVALNETAGFEYLGDWMRANTTKTTSFLYYRIASDTVYGEIRRHTYKFLSFSIKAVGGEQTTPNEFGVYDIPGEIYFSYLGFTQRNIMAKGYPIREQYLGTREDVGAVTSMINTDATEDQVMLVLGKPDRLLKQVISTNSMSAWPAVILIIGSLGIASVLFLLGVFRRVTKGNVVHFDPYLEICHRALDGVDQPQHSAVDGLLVKMQDTTLIMVDGYSPAHGGNKMGLMPCDTIILPLAKSEVYT